jgi:DNA-binding beta-propeller fold protein YncE
VFATDSVNGLVVFMDELTHTVHTVPVGASPHFAGVDLTNHRLYVSNSGDDTVSLVDIPDGTPATPLKTAISLGNGHATIFPSPQFSFTTSSGYDPTPITDSVYFQVDSIVGPWQMASGIAPNFVATVGPLTQGDHVIYAYAVDAMQGTSIDTASYTIGLTGTVVGSLSAYAFTVLADDTIFRNGFD